MSGLTEAGWIPKTFETCKSELLDDFRTGFGQNLHTTDDEIPGIFATILGDREAELWSQGGKIWSARFLGSATGASLARALAYAGTSLKGETFSVVELSLSGTGGTIVPAGSESEDADGRVWIHASEVIIPGTTLASPAEAGPVPGLAGTITVPGTSIAGWTGVTNALDATLGRYVESAAAARKRLTLGFRAAGGSSLDAMWARLLAPVDEGGAGCDDVIVVENKSQWPDSDGRPPKSFECVCQGGVEADIARIIWKGGPMGIESFGAISVNVVDARGDTQVVEYTRPTNRDIHLLVTYLRDTEAATFPKDVGVPIGTDHLAMGTGELAMRDAILASVSSSMGKDVVPFQLMQAIEVPGIRELTIGAGFATLPGTTTPLAIARFERAIFDSTRIRFVRQG